MHGEKVKSVYCHWDGYLDHNGVILLGHYYDSAKVNNLVALGDLSSLRPELGEKHAFGDKVDCCTFYGRDRNETGAEFQVAQTFAEFLEQCENCWAEYYYIMKDGVWYVGDTYEGTPLSYKLTALTDVLVLEKILDEQT
jgi:hypothetical protein